MKLHEMQDWRNHSGNRRPPSPLVNRIGTIDEALMGTKADKEWEEFSNNILPEDSPYWNNLDEDQLRQAIITGEELAQKYGIEV